MAPAKLWPCSECGFQQGRQKWRQVWASLPIPLSGWLHPLPPEDSAPPSDRLRPFICWTLPRGTAWLFDIDLCQRPPYRVVPSVSQGAFPSTWHNLQIYLFPLKSELVFLTTVSLSVQGIFQARVPEWADICFSRGSSQPRDQTRVSCIADRHFTVWATREA